MNPSVNNLFKHKVGGYLSPQKINKYLRKILEIINAWNVILIKANENKRINGNAQTKLYFLS